MREISFAQAICEATSQCMEADASVYIMGLGVPDPGNIFGTTKGLREKFGATRVLDMPIAENGMTGIAIGTAIAGMRPILTHQRVDFMLLAMEQIVNQAAKWHYMFDGQMRVPLVMRIIIGRGWGQGAQHSQSLHSWFAHIPGLKVVMPFSPEDAKGLLISAIEDNNPVIFFEHRWLHNVKTDVAEKMFRTPIGKAKIMRTGTDFTIIAVSHMVYEALQAANLLTDLGISVEVVDLRTIRPIDTETILNSVAKTGKVLVADLDWASCGLSAEIMAVITENIFAKLKIPPQRITYPDYPVPTSPALSENYYPTAKEIALKILSMLEMKIPQSILDYERKTPHDVPDISFKGPF